MALWPLHQTTPLNDNVLLNSHHTPAKAQVRRSTTTLAPSGLEDDTAAAAADATASSTIPEEPADADTAAASSTSNSPAGHAQEHTGEDGDDNGELCLRNMSSAIALLRVLQKVIKNRPIRQMAAVVEGGSIILKRILRMENPWLNLYVLKVIKGMAIFCGRGWRKTNMRLLSR